jgi:hypothetical protein
MRPLNELINTDDSAWPLVREWIDKTNVKVEILPADQKCAYESLLVTQVTTRSPMGAIVHNTAGIFIDHGWLRILGAGGHERFQRSLPGWNAGRSNGFYLIADDALGGSFAINGGAFGDDVKMIYYYAPDALRWEACHLSYSDFLVWAMSGKLDTYYESEHWPGWQTEVAKLTGDQVLNVFPFLFTKGPPIAERTRRAIPVAELYALQLDLQRQLDGS